MDVVRSDSHSKDGSACPYGITSIIKPGLAHSLNSLESGRLLVSVRLGSSVDVEKVWAELINEFRRNRFESIEGKSDLKRETSIRASLSRQKEDQSLWVGEIGIPTSWTEGNSVSIERTGSFTWTKSGDYFSLEISYLMPDGMQCSARFTAQDAYHWTLTVQ